MTEQEFTKKCCTCKEIKPYSEFQKDSARIDGLQIRCRKCFKCISKSRSSKNKLMLEANPSLIPDTKVCHSCKQDKPRFEFSKDGRSKDGLQGKCKQCYNNYVLANKEAVYSTHRVYRYAHKEEKSMQDRVYRAEHKEKMAAWQKAYREVNREERLAKKKA
jgi:hypothetical protein